MLRTTLAMSLVLMLMPVSAAVPIGPADVSPTDDAHGDYAVSGTGNAYGGRGAVSVLGDAHAAASPLSATGECNGERCVDVATDRDASAHWVALSGFGRSNASFAASGTGDAWGRTHCWAYQNGSCRVGIAAAGTGDANGSWSAVSGTGDATNRKCNRFVVVDPRVATYSSCGVVASGTGRGTNAPGGPWSVSGCILLGTCA